jgi:hypothetical protein
MDLYEECRFKANMIEHVGPSDRESLVLAIIGVISAFVIIKYILYINDLYR